VDGEAPTCLVREECRRAGRGKKSRPRAARRSRRSRLPARSSHPEAHMAAIEAEVKRDLGRRAARQEKKSPRNGETFPGTSASALGRLQRTNPRSLPVDAAWRHLPRPPNPIELNPQMVSTGRRHARTAEPLDGERREPPQLPSRPQLCGRSDPAACSGCRTGAMKRASCRPDHDGARTANTCARIGRHSDGAEPEREMIARDCIR